MKTRLLKDFRAPSAHSPHKRYFLMAMLIAVVLGLAILTTLLLFFQLVYPAG